MTQGLSWFDRTLNSTLLVPQQLLFRLGRVAQGRADLLSDRGLMDMSLIPFIGIADDDRHDVTADERARMLGLRPDTVEAFLADLVTDPTMYLTAGSTGVGRAALQLGKAAHAAGKALGPEVAEQLGEMSVRKAIPMLQDALQNADHLRAGKRAKLTAGLDDVAARLGADSLDDMTVDALRRRARETEMRIGLPGAIGGLPLSIRSPVQHRGWISLASVPVTRTVGSSVNFLAGRNIKVLSPTFREIRAFGAGLRTGTSPRVIVEEAELLPEFAEYVEKIGGDGAFADRVSRQDETRRIMSRWGRGDPNAWRSSVAKHQQDRDLIESFRTMLTKDPEGSLDEFSAKKRWDALRADVGLQPAPLTWQTLGDFLDDFGEVARFDDEVAGSLALRRTVGGKLDLQAFQESTVGFAAGETLSRWWHKVFTGNSGIRDYDEVRKSVSQIVNSQTRGNEHVLREFTRMVQGVAKASGDTDEEVINGLSAISQLMVMSDELHLVAAGLDTDTLNGLETHLRNFLDRVAQMGSVLDQETGSLPEAVRRGLEAAGLGRGEIDMGSPIWRINRKVEELTNIYAKAAKDGVDAHPGHLWLGLSNDFEAYNQKVLGGFLEVAGDAGRDYMDALGALKTRHLELARKYGRAGFSVPLGYLPRVFTKAEAERLVSILGDFEKDPIFGSIAKSKATEFRRMDHIPVETLNGLLDELRQADIANNGAGASGIYERLLELDPQMADRFSPIPHVSLMASFSRFQEFANNADMLNKIVNGAGDTEDAAVFAGEIVGVMSGRSVTATVDRMERVAGMRGVKTGADFRAVIAKEKLELPTSSLLVRSQKSGRVQVVPLESLENEIAGFVAGEGTDLGTAAGAAFAKDGKLKNALTATMTPAQLEQFIGKQAMFGPVNMVKGIESTIGKTTTTTPAWLRYTLDPAHNILKAGATIINPSFHVNNLASLFPMLHMAGASMPAVLGAWKDTWAMLNFDPQFTDAMGSLSRLTNEDAGFFSKTARSAFEFVTRIDPQKARNVVEQTRISGGIGATRAAAERFMVSGSNAYDVPELWRIWGEEGLLNTFGVEGLRSAGRETRAIAEASRMAGRKVRGTQIKEGARELWKNGKFDHLWDSANKLTAEGRDTISKLGESSEVVARITGALAFMRMGYDPRTAARMTRDALVDYSDLTEIERRYFKRIFSFYTFPRKMIPNILRHMNEDPQSFVGMAKGLYNLPGAEVDQGRLQAHWDDYRINVQRAVPQLDALSSAAYMADVFFDWDTIRTTPELQGDAPIRLGIPGSIVRAVFPDGWTSDPGVEHGFAEALGVSYATRWATRDRKDPLAPEQTVFEKFAMQGVLGIRKPGEHARVRWLSGQYSLLRSELERRIEESTDADERRELIREFNQMTATLGELLR